MARILHRIVRTNPPALSDFLSDAERGRVRPDASREAQRLGTGRSMFATEAQARRRARQWPALGAYIARVEIPLDESVQVERSLRNSPGHHTVWGDAAALLAWVTQLVPV